MTFTFDTKIDNIEKSSKERARELKLKKLNDIKKEYVKKFKKKPKIIGMFKNDITKLILNIEKAIKDNKPYNEYDLLSDEEKKAFDSGDLVF